MMTLRKKDTILNGCVIKSYTICTYVDRYIYVYICEWCPTWWWSVVIIARAVATKCAQNEWKKMAAATAKKKVTSNENEKIDVTFNKIGWFLSLVFISSSFTRRSRSPSSHVYGLHTYAYICVVKNRVIKSPSFSHLYLLARRSLTHSLTRTMYSCVNMLYFWPIDWMMMDRICILKWYHFSKLHRTTTTTSNITSHLVYGYSK